MGIGNEKARTYDLVVYGGDKAGFTLPIPVIEDTNFTLHFEPYDTSRRLNEFDGAVIFQGIFERFGTGENAWGHSYVKSWCDRDELDKRKKELELLLRKKGMVCFLLRRPFLDKAEGEDFSDFDLAKQHLNYPNLHRDDLPRRFTKQEVMRDELRRFFEEFGAANSYFVNRNRDIDWRVIARIGNYVTSMVLWRKIFFIPVLVPRAGRTGEFFQLLCDGLVAARNKLLLDVPEWVNEFRFNHEDSLVERRRKALQEAEATADDLAQLGRFKRLLVLDGENLVDAVKYVLVEGFGLRVDAYDEFREDLKILDQEGNPIILVEIKGTNRGVKREHVNQTDSHRERASLPPDFPAVLIMNTHIKNSRTIEEKDQEIATEQVIRAANTNVLVLRTLDLLSLLRIYLAGNLPADGFLKLLITAAGWLRVVGDEIEVLKE